MCLSDVVKDTPSETLSNYTCSYICRTLSFEFLSFPRISMIPSSFENVSPSLFICPTIIELLLLSWFPRFLRYVPVVYVDYPGATSLSQIYGTFNRAMLRLIPTLRSSAQQLTDAMVEFYTMSQVMFYFVLDGYNNKGTY